MIEHFLFVMAVFIVEKHFMLFSVLKMCEYEVNWLMDFPLINTWIRL